MRKLWFLLCVWMLIMKGEERIHEIHISVI